MNIDELLTPVRAPQPNNIYLLPTAYPTSQIERFPYLANDSRINPQFQEFYDTVVDGLCGMNPHTLYTISDEVLSENEFVEMFNEIWKPDLVKLVGRTKKCRAIDIELSFDRLNDYIHNIVLSFSISGYVLEKTESKMFKNKMKMYSKYTELLFTFKDGKFKVISKFPPFQSFDFDD